MNEEQTSRATPIAPGLRQPEERLQPAGNFLLEYVRQYARDRPEVVVLGCLAIGFVLGWKLKQW